MIGFSFKKDFEPLCSIAKDLRRRVIINSSLNKIPHLGSCLSCLEILVYLYWIELKIDSNNSTHKNRDRLILSKGHAAPVLYQVLAERGFFNKKELDKFGKNGSYFHEHPPKPGLINGIEAATGSLGHGLPMALGMSIASKVSNANFRCFVIISDGECNEGSIWEAAMMASSNKIKNLVVIVDYNKWQATGRSKEILSLEPLADKWKAFGWSVYQINGHSFTEMDKIFRKINKKNIGPSIIIAHTIKGKGVSFMEDNNNWHYRIPNKEELDMALSELL